jgi:hypothetical protein
MTSPVTLPLPSLTMRIRGINGLDGDEPHLQAFADGRIGLRAQRGQGYCFDKRRRGPTIVPSFRCPLNPGRPQCLRLSTRDLQVEDEVDTVGGHGIGQLAVGLLEQSLRFEQVGDGAEPVVIAVLIDLQIFFRLGFGLAG